MAVTQKGLIGKTDPDTIRQSTEAACLPVISSLPSNSRGKRKENRSCSQLQEKRNELQLQTVSKGPRHERRCQITRNLALNSLSKGRTKQEEDLYFTCKTALCGECQNIQLFLLLLLKMLNDELPISLLIINVSPKSIRFQPR